MTPQQILEEVLDILSSTYDIRRFDGTTYGVREEFAKDITTLYNRGVEAGRRDESSEISEAIKRLSMVDNQKHWDNDLSSSATMMMNAYQDEQTHKYIKHLEEKVRNLTFDRITNTNN